MLSFPERVFEGSYPPVGDASFRKYDVKVSDPLGDVDEGAHLPGLMLADLPGVVGGDAFVQRVTAQARAHRARVGGRAERAGRVAGEVAVDLVEVRRDVERIGGVHTVRVRDRGEDIALGLGGVRVVGDELRRRVAVGVGAANRPRRRVRERQHRGVDGDLIERLLVGREQLEAVVIAEQVVGPSEGAPRLHHVVQHGVGRGGVEAALGGLEAPADEEARAADLLRVVEGRDDQLVAAVDNLGLAGGASDGVARGHVDDGAQTEAVLGGEAAGRDVKLLHEPHRDEVAELSEREREDRDAVDDVRHAAVRGARVQEAIGVGDEPRLCRQHTRQRLGVPSGQCVEHGTGHYLDACAGPGRRRDAIAPHRDVFELVGGGRGNLGGGTVAAAGASAGGEGGVKGIGGGGGGGGGGGSTPASVGSAAAAGATVRNATPTATREAVCKSRPCAEEKLCRPCSLVSIRHPRERPRLRPRSEQADSRPPGSRRLRRGIPTATTGPGTDCRCRPRARSRTPTAARPRAQCMSYAGSLVDSFLQQATTRVRRGQESRNERGSEGSARAFETLLRTAARCDVWGLGVEMVSVPAVRR